MDRIWENTVLLEFSLSVKFVQVYCQVSLSCNTLLCFISIATLKIYKFIWIKIANIFHPKIYFKLDQNLKLDEYLKFLCITGQKDRISFETQFWKVLTKIKIRKDFIIFCNWLSEISKVGKLNTERPSYTL